MAFSYTRNLTDDEAKILKDSILDIKKWIDDAIDGKVNNSMKRLANRRREELIISGQTEIPATNIDLSLNAFADPDYKNRVQRDLEENSK